MPKQYFWDLDSTLIPMQLREYHDSAYQQAVMENKNTNPTSSPEFSRIYVKHLKKILKCRGYDDNNLLINQENILPILQTILDNEQKIVLSSAGFSSNIESEELIGSPVFHIFNAYLENFSRDTLDSLQSKRVNNLMWRGDQQHNDAEEFAHAALVAGLTHKDYQENEIYLKFQQEYKNIKSDKPMICHFRLNMDDNSPESLFCEVEINVETFLQHWKQNNRQFGEDYADTGQKFLLIVKYLFEQGIKVNFPDAMQAYGLKVTYPPAWQPRQEINAADVVLIDDKPVFLQFLELAGGTTIQADTGDAYKEKIKHANKEGVRSAAYQAVKFLSDSEIAQDHTINTFLEPLLGSIKQDYGIEKLRQVDTSWEQQLAIPAVSPASPLHKQAQPHLSKTRKVLMAGSTVGTGVAAGSVMGGCLAGLLVSYTKVTTLCIGAGITAGGVALGPLGAIVGGIVGAGVAAAIAFVSASAAKYATNRFFKESQQPEKTVQNEPGVNPVKSPGGK